MGGLNGEDHLLIEWVCADLLLHYSLSLIIGSSVCVLITKPVQCRSIIEFYYVTLYNQS